MSQEAKKAGLFVKEVLARLTGDNTEAVANKIARKSLCAVETQISGLKSAINDKEDEVADRKEALEDAIYPSEVFSTGKEYINRVSVAKEAFDRSTEELQDLKDQLAFWNDVMTTRFE